MKKRVLALILGGLVTLSLCACSDTGTDAPQEENASKQEQKQNEKSEFGVGETWTVDGQWTMTVTSVEETQDRNQFSDKTPGAVYIVNYTYTNVGYEDEDGFMDGLYIDMEDTIVDSAGTMGYSYPGDITNYARETPVGATCNAQACIGVDNPGDLKITVTKYDGNGDNLAATFNLSVPM